MAGTQGTAAEAILKTDVGSQAQGGHGDTSLGPIPCDPIVNACVFRPVTIGGRPAASDRTTMSSDAGTQHRQLSIAPIERHATALTRCF